MPPQPWKSADATNAIRSMGNDAKLALSYSDHAKERLAERDLIMSDVLYVLKMAPSFKIPGPQPNRASTNM